MKLVKQYNTQYLVAACCLILLQANQRPQSFLESVIDCFKNLKIIPFYPKLYLKNHFFTSLFLSICIPQNTCINRAYVIYLNIKFKIFYFQNICLLITTINPSQQNDTFSFQRLTDYFSSVENARKSLTTAVQLLSKLHQNDWFPVTKNCLNHS